MTRESQNEPVESLYRSLLLVFMDNTTAEYTFIKAFFCDTPSPPNKDVDTPRVQSPPPGLLSPDRSNFDDNRSISGSIYGAEGASPEPLTSKEEQVAAEFIWKQVIDPVLTYTEVS
jgi:vacuolar protein sorting-associated protein 52